MDRLSVHCFPVFGAFVVAECVEEGFSEGRLGGEARGPAGGGGFMLGRRAMVGFVAFGSVVVVMARVVCWVPS